VEVRYLQEKRSDVSLQGLLSKKSALMILTEGFFSSIENRRGDSLDIFQHGFEAVSQFFDSGPSRFLATASSPRIFVPRFVDTLSRCRLPPLPIMKVARRCWKIHTSKVLAVDGRW